MQFLARSCFEEDPVYDTVASDEEYDTIPSPKSVSDKIWII